MKIDMKTLREVLTRDYEISLLDTVEAEHKEEEFIEFLKRKQEHWSLEELRGFLGIHDADVLYEVGIL